MKFWPRLALLAGAILMSQQNLSQAQSPADPSDLARLAATVPGAGRLLAWDQSGAESPAPALADGDRTRPAAEPGHAVGVAWTIPHVIDQVDLYFADQPPTAAVELQVHDGVRFVAVEGLKAQPRPEDKALRLSFEPAATRQVRVRLPSAESVTELEVRPYLPLEKGRLSWPARLTTTQLQQEMLARSEEPSFEALSLYGLSMPAWAMMGLKDLHPEQAVRWDALVHSTACHVSWTLGDRRVGMGDVRDTVTRRLIDGWRPGVIVEGQVGPVAIRQTSLVAFADAQRTRAGTFIRLELTNRSDKPWQGPLVVKAGLRKDLEDKITMRLVDSMLVTDTVGCVVADQPCRAGPEKNALALDIDLPPGGSKQVDLFTPLLKAAPDDLRQLAALGYDRALANFRAYWDELLAPAMRIELPEPRLNDLYRAVLTQFFINGHGNIMPYGATPSAYDGSLYGVEEGYVMMALGMYGLGGDAERYMDGTYLTPEFLKKVEKYGGYGDRHQQYRNGLQPMYAVELYRLTRDRAWLAKHAALLKQCAEWTIANRRKTMVLEDGKKPPHWGLLEKWSYGGDLADEQCYPLYANFACWRGLKETAWALAELGQSEPADRYEKEADDYHKRIMEVVDAIYHVDAKPPLLPPHVYAKGPTGDDYYQLFAGCSLDLLPFRFDDKRANYFGDFLLADNRVFCHLPRFRRDVGPGGLDAIYGLGHILTLLHQGRTRDFQLAFYAYLVFNMEHGCFTSRETNALYASDTHRRTAFPVPDVSDPLPCSSAVAALLLRHMLLTEENLGAGEYTGRLMLLRGAPQRWLAAGQTVAVENAPTHFGPVSFRVTSQADKGAIQAELTPPSRNPCQAIVLRLPHPEGKPIRGVTVNGQPHAAFDPAASTVTLASPHGPYRVEAKY